MATRTLTVVLAGDAKGAVNALGRTDSAFGKLGRAAGVAAIATGAAFTAIGVKGTLNAKALEEGLAEVRTLLPELTDGGFDQLRKDVIAFSDEMGVATTQAVPALYQAISAGVPRENAIAFLETASKAAIGGVTDLETAVDGITSVVNAYGREIISSAEASDLMFTAVRLGKTTFEELSSSLFNVAPMAKTAGIGFEQITAALASLTAQGTPTSVATTQLRQAILALAAPSSETAQIMKDMGLEFDATKLSQVGLAGAFQEVIDAADGDLQVLRRLLGSTEALQAVLGLTGDNAAGFAANLAAMEQSAGATDAAFETMDDTLSRRWTRTMNRVNNMFTRLGFVLLPHVDRALTASIEMGERFSGWAQENLLPVLREWGQALADRVVPALAQLGEWITTTALPAVQAFAVELGERLGPLFAQLREWVIETALPALREFGAWIQDTALPQLRELAETIATKLQPTLTALREWVVETALPALRQLSDWVREFVPAIGDWLRENKNLIQSIGIAVGILGSLLAVAKIGIVVVGVLKAGVALLAGAFAVLLSPVVLITIAVVALTAVLVHLYRNNETFRAFVDDRLVPALKRLGEFILGGLQAAFGWARDFVVDHLVPALVTISGWIVATGLPKLGEFARFIGENLLAAFGAARDWINDNLLPTFRAIGETLTAVWEDVLLPTLDAIRDGAIAAFQAVVTWATDNWSTLETLLTTPIDLAKIAIVAVFNTLVDAVELILAVFRGDWDRAWTELKEIVTGIFDAIVEFVGRWQEGFLAAVELALDIGGKVASIGRDLGSALFDGIIGALSGLASEITSMLPSPGDVAGGVVSGITGALGFAEGGIVPGPMGAPRLAVVHGGEEVLTPTQRRDRRGGVTVVNNLYIDATGGDPERIGEVLFPALEALFRRGMIRDLAPE